jgi:hypothetical protein
VSLFLCSKCPERRADTVIMKSTRIPTHEKELESKDIYKGEHDNVEGHSPSKGKSMRAKPSRETKALPSLDELESNPLTQDEAAPPKKGGRSSLEMSEKPARAKEDKAKEGGERREAGVVKGDVKAPDRFKGLNPLQYALWAHYMSLGAIALCLYLGIVAILWEHPKTYGCHVRGKPIFANYRVDSTGFCNNTVIIEATGEPRQICCDPNVVYHSLKGNKNIGALYIIYAFVLVILENTTWGFGLWYPNDSLVYRCGISPCFLVNLVVGAAGFVTYATMLPGACLIVLAAVQAHAARRGECGDGGRKANAAARAKAAKDAEPMTVTSFFAPVRAFCCEEMPRWNPYTFFTRIYNEDKLSTYVWVFIYLGANAITFIYMVNLWADLVKLQESQLLHGTLPLTCNTVLCKMNRKVLRYGTLSPVAPFAKGCGACLNFNCALLLLPIIKVLLRKINNAGVSFSNAQHSTDLFGKFFARPLTRYVPLQKNIEFHKLVATMVFMFAWGHLVMHYLNLIWADASTVAVFTMFGWVGTAWFTGSIVSLSMFIIYSAAPDVVRQAKFEIFFYSHHMFTVFFLIMFLHGPVFFYWTCIPVLLYIYERYTQAQRGKCPFVINKVEWIPPVMAVYFRPVFKVILSQQFLLVDQSSFCCTTGRLRV